LQALLRAARLLTVSTSIVDPAHDMPHPRTAANRVLPRDGTIRTHPARRLDAGTVRERMPWEKPINARVHWRVGARGDRTRPAAPNAAPREWGTQNTYGNHPLEREWRIDIIRPFAQYSKRPRSEGSSFGSHALPVAQPSLRAQAPVAQARAKALASETSPDAAGFFFARRARGELVTDT
jgi:hypothetical protein